jgi:flagellin-like hook-associated protein FlgL
MNSVVKVTTSNNTPQSQANIQSIMASEKQVNILMQLLDEALSEVDTIEGKMSSYEEMLQSVKEQMDQISQSNRLIQISNTNNGKLLDEIQFLVVRIGFHVSVGLFF